LDRKGVAVRAGKHCAHPLSDSLGLVSSLRASFHAYSTLADVQALVEGVAEAAAQGGRL
jgi:selenocysteine lyase/cysteine desulfurase